MRKMMKLLVDLGARKQVKKLSLQRQWTMKKSQSLKSLSASLERVLKRLGLLIHSP